MHPGHQLLHGVLLAPAALGRLSLRAWAWLLAYLLLAGAVLGGVGALLLAHRDDLRGWALTYLFPDEWHLPAGLVLDGLLASQERAVVLNATLTGSLILVSLVLFWAKEHLSAAFERDGQLTDAPGRGHPLAAEAFEEVKLLILYLAGFASLFWLGYPPDPTRRLAASILSYAFLFFTVAVDFTAPLLLRHGLAYSQVIKTLAKHPLALFGFGALFAAPPLLTAHLAGAQKWSLEVTVGAVFAVEVVTIAWAAVGGTWLAARLLPDARRTPSSAVWVRVLAWAALLGVFAANVAAFGALGVAAHHKSQLLKCRYDVAWSTVRLDSPNLAALLTGKVETGLSFDLTIENPTPFVVAIEHTRLEVAHAGDRLAQSALTPLTVPPGETARQTVHLRLSLDATQALKGAALLRDAWTVTLWVRVAEGFELPIYLVSRAPD